MSAIEASIIVAHPEVCATYVRWCSMFPDASIHSLVWVFEHRQALDVWMDTPEAPAFNENVPFGRPYDVMSAVERFEQEL